MTIKIKKWKSPIVKCIITNEDGEYHHVYTRKSHPQYEDEEWNLMPLSRRMHTLIHSMGLKTFVERHGRARAWLEKNGWYQDYTGKWRHT